MTTIRLVSRSAALEINIVSNFSYTLESLIQAGRKHLAVTSVPIRTNAKLRESRLFRSMFQFIKIIINKPSNSNICIVVIWSIHT